jgi:hypothetical protein
MTDVTPVEERICFKGFEIQKLPAGGFEAEVTLTWGSHPPLQGTAQSAQGDSGDLTCAAQACLNALAAVSRETEFELLGVRAVQAFDATVVIVSVAAASQVGGPRLVGSYLAAGDLPRGAALAVLNATNRFISTLPTRAT